MTDIINDFSDGLLLIYMVEILRNKPIEKYSKNCKFRVQKANNITMVISVVRSDGIQTTASPLDFMDGRIKSILQFLWILISRYRILKLETGSTREKILNFVNKQLENYEIKNVRNLKKSWMSGEIL